MTDSLQTELAALREVADRLPGAGAAAVASDALRWAELDRILGAEVRARRVLVVGDDVGYDVSAFRARGASEVAACESSGWEGLDPARDGTFDIVHCNGLLHRVPEPVTLLRRLRSVATDDATLLIGSMMLADPERSEYLRFIPTNHAGDPTWWFVPGRLALRWLLHSAGFAVTAEFGDQEGPRDGFPVVSGYLRAVASE